MPKNTDALKEAVAYETEIAGRAKAIRGNAEGLTPKLFMELWPLLCEPVPEGFIQSVPKQTGKPYDSTGIKSVQVQVDRMNNVLTPLWWHDAVEYHADGRAAHVKVFVRNGSDVLVLREAWGGVDRGSTLGNVYKGSYTNAAKLAFARVGPGHEVYLGATDFDPDVDAQAIQPGNAPARGTAARKITKAKAEELWEAANRAGVLDKLQLAAAHVAGMDVGKCDTKGAALTALVKLSTAQAGKLAEWIARKSVEALGVEP